MDHLGEFVIPTSHEILEKLPEDGESFYVEDVLPVSDMKNAEIFSYLDNVDAALSDEKSFSIVQNSNFDVLYSFAANFSHLDQTAQTRMVDILCSGLTCLLGSMTTILSTSVDDIRFDRQLNLTLSIHRNALKMYVYLIHWIMGIVEVNSRQQAEAKKAIKSSRSRRNRTNRSDGEFQKERSIKILTSVLEHDISKLWIGNGEVEETFAFLFFKYVFSFLENPVSMKIRSIREALARLLSVASNTFANKPPSTLPSAVSSLLSYVMKHDHISSALADILELSSDEIDNNNNQNDNRRLSRRQSSISRNLTLPNELMIEIGRLEPGSLALDTSAAKNLSSFISELAERLPELVLVNMHVLFSHLESDPYTLRNGVIHAISRLLASPLITKNSSETTTKTRNSLLLILMERFHDVHAFTRSKVLQCWSFLCERRLIPLKAHPDVMDLAIGRIRDKSAIVRKSALQFLQVALSYNPFGAILKRSLFVERRSKLVEQHESRQSNNTSTVERMITHASDAVRFISQIDRAVESTVDMLGSKTSSDILECIKFIQSCHSFGVDKAWDAICSMLPLVWSREQSISETLENTILEIFFTYDSTSAKDFILAARSLVRLALTCHYSQTFSGLAALEDILVSLVKKEKVPKAIVLALWEVFSGRVKSNDGSESEDSVGAAIVLAMLSSAQPAFARKHLSTLFEYGFSSRKLATQTCVILQKLRGCKDHQGQPEKIDDIEGVSQGIEGEGWSMEEWLPFAEQAISALFVLHSSPDTIITNLIQTLASRAFPDSEQNTDSRRVSVKHLSRLVFVLGAAAMRQLVALEEAMKEAKKQLAAKQQRELENTTHKDAIEDELGLNSTAAEETELEAMFEQKEKEIITSGSIFGNFAPMLLAICTKSEPEFNDPMLQKCAVLTLCKYMSVSRQFCEENLQLLFSIMADAKECETRANIAVALGDLAARFPNSVEPWTGHFYGYLQDPSPKVRKTTLLVLTHLILNDMIKVKGNISVVALCMEDPEPSIVSCARAFFTEWSRKGGNTNVIYNILPDTISHLTNNANVTPEMFERILRFLLSFVTKERQTERLVDKLCNRIKNAEPHQWSSLSYCISLLNHSDRSIRRLIEDLKLYKHALADETLYHHLNDVGTKAAKNAKGDLKSIIDEWLENINQLFDKMVEAGSYRPMTHKTPRRTPRRTPRNSQSASTTRSRNRKNQPSRRRRQRMPVVEDSEDSSEDEEDWEEKQEQEATPMEVDEESASDSEENPTQHNRNQDQVGDDEMLLSDSDSGFESSNDDNEKSNLTVNQSTQNEEKHSVASKKRETAPKRTRTRTRTRVRK
eukprot:gb/GECH01009257.1/.p1 GENE.gb/GECH01009257.1/~~gb/GECH01009257.1/.p1  ORF type:complete len:1324 (+),score=347.64 gb/GECH01009257.1/:1-3972(+)